MKLLALLPLVLLLPSLTWAQGRTDAFVPDPEPPTPSSIRPGAPWQELPTRLPPWPKDSDLIELELDGAPDGLRYFVDGKNLSVGPDKVVRYTLVAEGPSGTRNLSVEGIRCTPKGRYKVFAYGVSGHFSPLQGSEWQRVETIDGERYRRELWRYHFCDSGEFKHRRKQDIIRSLRGHVTPRQSTGLQIE